MRVAAILLILVIAAPAAAGRPIATASQPAPHCPRTTSYLANANGLYRGKPLAPKKLTELPPATGYMAVYRQIDGCEAPLTIVDYRGARRR